MTWTDPDELRAEIDVTQDGGSTPHCEPSIQRWQLPAYLDDSLQALRTELASVKGIERSVQVNGRE